MSSRWWWRKGGRRLAATLTLTVACTSLAATHLLPATGPDYHPDEGLWTATGKYYFQLAFIDRDFSYASWSVRWGAFGPRYPTLGKYIIGASLFAHGAVDRTSIVPGFAPDFDWKEVANRRPPPAMLAAARAPMAWLGAGCAALLFLLGRELFQSWFVGLGAGLLFSVKHLILISSRRAMMEIPTTLFTLTALVIAAHLLMRATPASDGRRRLATAGIGLACGLGVATKLNSVFAAMTVALWIVVASGRGTRLARLAQELGAIAAIMAAVFFASNPLLYHRPIAHTLSIVSLSTTVSQYPTAPKWRLETPGERLAETLATGLGSSGPAERWLHAAWADEALALGGLALALLWVARPGPGDGRRQIGATLFLIWGGITLGGIIALIPFRWERWFVPMEPWWSLLEALGIAAALTAGAAAVAKARARAQR